jgi:hypothetical protein
MVANFLVKQIFKHGRKKGTKKVKEFLDFVKTGKYKGKNVDKEAQKVKPGELDLETMTPPSQKKMAGGGIALRGFGRAFRKGGKV